MSLEEALEYFRENVLQFEFGEAVIGQPGYIDLKHPGGKVKTITREQFICLVMTVRDNCPVSQPEREAMIFLAVCQQLTKSISTRGEANFTLGTEIRAVATQIIAGYRAG